MPRLNKLLTGHDITDEVINRTGSTALALDHDTMLASSVVVRTAAGGGGTLLTLTTDYTLGSEDTRLTTDAGATVYTTLAVVNGAYQNMNLYVTYKTVGDYTSVESAIHTIFDNDGPGSGLNADLLDGNHATYFPPKPNNSATSVVGSWSRVNASPGATLKTPTTDGVWAYFSLHINASSGIVLATYGGVANGSASDLQAAVSGYYFSSLFWRIG